MNTRYFEDEYHWYVTSAANWVTENRFHLSKAIRTLRKLDGKDWDFAIWRVPGPADSEYEIDNYAPQVEGAEMVADHQEH